MFSIDSLFFCKAQIQILVSRCEKSERFQHKIANVSAKMYLYIYF